VVQGHERDLAALLVDRVGVGDQRDLLQEPGQTGLLGARLVLARDAHQLLEVLDAALRLDRALGLVGGDHAGAREHGLDPAPRAAPPAPLGGRRPAGPPAASGRERPYPPPPKQWRPPPPERSPPPPTASCRGGPRAPRAAPGWSSRCRAWAC